MLTEDGRSIESGPTFLGWAGDPRQATDPKIAAREFAAALERFLARFSQPATVVRVPLSSLITSYPGVHVEPVRTVPLGQVWPGAVLRPRTALPEGDSPDQAVASDVAVPVGADAPHPAGGRL